MSKVYKGIISVADKFVPNKFRPLWDHPAGKFNTCTSINLIKTNWNVFFFVLGPKTIFFWAPAFKWVSNTDV